MRATGCRLTQRSRQVFIFFILVGPILMTKFAQATLFDTDGDSATECDGSDDDYVSQLIKVEILKRNVIKTRD